MRRPTPLPPRRADPPRPPASGDREVDDVPRTLLPPRRVDPPRCDERSAEGSAAGESSAPGIPADEAETQPVEELWHQRGRDYGVAPVLPFGSATAQRPPGVVAPGTADRDGNGEVDGGPERPARLTARDVWAAARARRRALRREVRRFTARQRRRRRVWLISAAALVALVLGSIGAAYSPLFAVETIEVVGTSQLDTAAVQQALAGQLGTPMPLVDESAVKAALVQFPLVESYSLEARPPHDLVVRIVERTPVGVLAGDAGYTLVDAAGVALSTTPEPPAGQPLLEVEGGLSSPAFAAVGQVFRSLPEALRTQVTAISATTANDVTLTLADGRAVVWGGATGAGEKVRILDALMVASPDAAAYDVSSPQAAVVR